MKISNIFEDVKTFFWINAIMKVYSGMKNNYFNNLTIENHPQWNFFKKNMYGVRGRNNEFKSNQYVFKRRSSEVQGK